MLLPIINIIKDKLITFFINQIFLNKKLISSLTFKNIYLLLTTISILYLYYNTFYLNKYMKNTIFDKADNVINYFGRPELTIEDTINSIMRLTGHKGQIFFVILEWKLEAPITQHLLKGRYITVLTYNHELKKIIDGKRLLKNQGKVGPNYDFHSSKFLVDHTWHNGRADFKTATEYAELAGKSVEIMFSNYPFEIYALTGATCVNKDNSTEAIRLIAVYDKELHDNIEKSQMSYLVERARTQYIEALKSI